MAPLDGSDPADAAEVILHELEKFSPALTQRDRWLVLNKADQLLEDEREQRVRQVVERLDWKGPVSVISALERSEEHTSELQSLMRISYAVFCLKKKNNQKTYIMTNEYN